MSDALLSGEKVCGGTVSGPVRVVTDPKEAFALQPGEILVVPHSHPEFALAMIQAGGVICENGGILSHLCTVALELGIPCVTEVKDATGVLSTSMQVTLDGDRGLVYAH
jgi:phosphohistidine swiveling domain-containing protein